MGTGLLRTVCILFIQVRPGGEPRWEPHDTRDQIVDFVRRWSVKTEIGAPHVERYNNVRLDSAIRYIAPKDMIAARQWARPGGD